MPTNFVMFWLEAENSTMTVVNINNKSAADTGLLLLQYSELISINKSVFLATLTSTAVLSTVTKPSNRAVHEAENDSSPKIL